MTQEAGTVGKCPGPIYPVLFTDASAHPRWQEEPPRPRLGRIRVPSPLLLGAPLHRSHLSSWLLPLTGHPATRPHHPSLPVSDTPRNSSKPKEEGIHKFSELLGRDSDKDEGQRPFPSPGHSVLAHKHLTR